MSLEAGPPLPVARPSAISARMRTDEQPIRLSLFAPKGRMGRAIAAAAAEDPGFVVDDEHGDVLVDFSDPSALQASLDRAVNAGIPILVGTTGLDDFAGRRLATAAENIAVLRAANTSRGVARLSELVARAATRLRADARRSSRPSADATARASSARKARSDSRRSAAARSRATTT